MTGELITMFLTGLLKIQVTNGQGSTAMKQISMYGKKPLLSDLTIFHCRTIYHRVCFPELRLRMPDYRLLLIILTSGLNGAGWIRKIVVIPTLLLTSHLN